MVLRICPNSDKNINWSSKTYILGRQKAWTHSFPFFCPDNKQSRQRTQWGMCFGSKSQKHESIKAGRQSSRWQTWQQEEGPHVQPRVQRRESKPEKGWGDVCPSARRHPSPVSLAGKQMFKYLSPWRPFLNRTTTLWNQKRTRKKKLAEESGEGWVLPVRIPDAGATQQDSIS